MENDITQRVAGFDNDIDSEIPVNIFTAPLCQISNRHVMVCHDVNLRKFKYTSNKFRQCIRKEYM